MVVGYVLGKFINSVVEKFELIWPKNAPVTAYQLPEHIAGYRERNIEPVRWVLREGYCEFDRGAFMYFELSTGPHWLVLSEPRDRNHVVPNMQFVAAHSGSLLRLADVRAI